MLWQGRRESGNVEDRRGIGGGSIAAGGGILGVIALVLNFLLGGSGGGTGQQMPVPGGQQPATQEQRAAQDQLSRFVKVVLADTEDTWGDIFRRAGETYPAPTLVLFSGSTQSGCGYASAQTGPFYCPADQKLYVDLSFYDELRSRFGGGGDFAMAYVIAHEVGHHIQTLMGTSEKMARARRQLSEAEYNQYSVRM
ncbi:MAG: metalloprotease, partial [Chitinophagaceae bacterium]